MDAKNLARVMPIGSLSDRTGVKVETIRYYESIGLLAAPGRTAANYRVYSPDHLARLSFIRRARSLGFSMPEITQLLSLWRDRERPSREVKAIAEKHVNELDARIAEMQTMADTLRHLSHCCAGDDRPDCPILADLTGGRSPVESKGADVRGR